MRTENRENFHQPVFVSPYTEWQEIELPRNADVSSSPQGDSDSLKFPPDSDIETVLKHVPTWWMRNVRDFHGIVCEEDEETAEHLVDRLTDRDILKNVLTRLPESCRDPLRIILEQEGWMLEKPLREELTRGMDNMLWVSPDAPRFVTSWLHRSGLLFLCRQDVKPSVNGAVLLEMIPTDLRPPLRELLEVAPESTFEFPVSDRVRFELDLPEEALFQTVEERMRKTSSMLDEQRTDDILHWFNSRRPDSFFFFSVLLTILADRENPREDRRYLVDAIINHAHEAVPAVHDLHLVEYLLFHPETWEEIIVGRDQEGIIHTFPSAVLQEKIDVFEEGPVSWEEFATGRFDVVRMINLQMRHLIRDAVLLAQPVLYHEEEPYETAKQWLSEEDPVEGRQSGLLENEILSLGMRAGDIFTKDQQRNLLEEGWTHRLANVRLKSLKQMKSNFPDLFQEHLPAAQDDEAKTVRDWAKKQSSSPDGDLQIGLQFD